MSDTPLVESANRLTEIQERWETRRAGVEQHCQEIAAELARMFDQRPEQAATLTALLNDFERECNSGTGFGAFLRARLSNREFVDQSAFGWSSQEELRAVALGAWLEAGRGLRSSATTRFGKHWAAVQTPPAEQPARVSEAVFSGAASVATLFDADFHVTGSAAVRLLGEAFCSFIGLRGQSSWQPEYWLKRKKDELGAETLPELSWWQRLRRWLRVLFGLPDDSSFTSMFQREGVVLEVVPRPVGMQHALWEGYAEGCREAGELDEDVTAWNAEFERANKNLKQSGDRHRELTAEIPRTVSADASADALRVAADLSRKLAMASTNAQRLLAGI